MTLGNITPKPTGGHRMTKGFCEDALSMYASVGGCKPILLFCGMNSIPFYSLLLPAKKI